MQRQCVLLRELLQGPKHWRAAAGTLCAIQFEQLSIQPFMDRGLQSELFSKLCLQIVEIRRIAALLYVNGLCQ